MKRKQPVETLEDVRTQQMNLRRTVARMVYEQNPWPEQHEVVPDLINHGAQLFTPAHERGPLIIWQHPEGCGCQLG